MPTFLLALSMVPVAHAEPAVPLSDPGRALWSLPNTSTKKATIAELFDPAMSYDHNGRYEDWSTPDHHVQVSATARRVDKVVVELVGAERPAPGLLPFGLAWTDGPADLRSKLGTPQPNGGAPYGTRWEVARGCDLAVSYDDATLTLTYVHIYCSDDPESTSTAPVVPLADVIGRPLRQPADLTGASEATLGWAAYNRGDAAAAVTHLSAAVAADPTDTDTAFGLGAALVRAGARRDGYDAMCELAKRSDPWLVDDIERVLAADGMRCGERPDWPPPKPSDFVATRLYAGPCTVTHAAEVVGRKTTAYSYGPEGWVTEERTWANDQPPDDSAIHQRDANGVLQRTNRQVVYDDGTTNLQTWTYAYDGSGRRTRQLVTHANGANPELSEYVYDAAGHLISESFDSGGHSEWSQGVTRYDYTFDAQGRITSTSDSSSLGTRVTHTTYDDQGRVSTITTDEGYGWDTAYTYDAKGRVWTEHIAYDSDKVEDITYAYDSFGNPVLETRHGVEANGDVRPVTYTIYDYACWAGR